MVLAKILHTMVVISKNSLGFGLVARDWKVANLILLLWKERNVKENGDMVNYQNVSYLGNIWNALLRNS